MEADIRPFIHDARLVLAAMRPGAPDEVPPALAEARARLADLDGLQAIALLQAALRQGHRLIG